MHLVDLARQVASDALTLKQQAGTTNVIFMTTTPIEFLGAEREARARAFLKYVRDGETVMLAGLISQTDSRSSSGAPGLSRIPFVGGLFGQQGRTDARSEVLPIRMWHIIESNLDVRAAAVSGVLIGATLLLMLAMERIAGISRHLR